jgi:hypothetical protein
MSSISKGKVLPSPKARPPEMPWQRSGRLFRWTRYGCTFLFYAYRCRIGD